MKATNKAITLGTGVLYFSKAELQRLVDRIQDTDEVVVVGDEGIYIMSFHEPKPRTIVYAQGTNPNVDEDWYEAKHEIWGGDDGVDVIGDGGKIKRLIAGPDKVVKMLLTTTQIHMQG